MVTFNRTTLSNGLTVIHEQRDVPVTTVMMAVRYGAMYESESEKGIAHFIEHLCFKGTEKRDAHTIAASLEHVGGDLNAFTHEEMTAYHVRLPSKHLALGIDVISDIFFHPIFPEEEVHKEANVICEEINMYRDNPRSHALEKIKENLYQKPYGMFTAGTAQGIKAMTRDQLLQKHRSIYIPQNSVLCVVGNNEFSEVISLAEKCTSLTRDGDLLKDNLSVVTQALDTSETRPDVLQSNLALGFHLPLSERERYAALVFNTILGEGMSSRLFSEVREKRGLVYTIRSHLDIGRNYGYLLIFAGTDPGHVSEVSDLSLSEFARMKDITEEELSLAKEQLIGSMIVEREGSNETAINLILEEFMSSAEDYYQFEQKVSEVTLQDIVHLASIAEHARFYVGP